MHIKYMVFTGLMLISSATYAAAAAKALTPNNLLFNGSASGDLEQVKKALAAGAHIDARDTFGRTALHLASEAGDVAVVAHLIAAGADIEARDDEGETPLFGASTSGRSAVVAQLIAAGANIQAKDRWNKTPLERANERLAEELEFRDPIVDKDYLVNFKQVVLLLRHGSKPMQFKPIPKL
jgi:ankyrin repeat protein